MRTTLMADQLADIIKIPSVRKADTIQVTAPPPVTIEDEYSEVYVAETKLRGVTILPPPFNPRWLRAIGARNNTLSQCITALVTNVAETGWEIREDEESFGTPTEKELDALRSFFMEPYPGESFTTQYSALVEAREWTGFAFLEILESKSGEIVGTRVLDSSIMRLVKLPDSYQTGKRKVYRNGALVELTLQVRERRFAAVLGAAQLSSGKLDYKVRYYKEFGSYFDVNAETGEFAEPGTLPLNLRASSVIYFPNCKDSSTPYGIPRWINVLPSIIGSRKNEELTLEWYDNGGIPPAIIFLNGGTLVSSVKDSLEDVLSGPAFTKNRAVVVPVQSAGGSMDNASNKVSVLVERFGLENGPKGDDQYDERCAARIRGAFRLPSIFTGLETNFTFATASVAYMVADAQVFTPQRRAFDEAIRAIPRAMGILNAKFRSMPLTIIDISTKLEALKLVSQPTMMVKGENFVQEINDTASLNLLFSQEEMDKSQQKGKPAEGQAVAPKSPTGGFKPPEGPRPSKKSEVKDDEGDDVLHTLVESVYPEHEHTEDLVNILGCVHNFLSGADNGNS